MNAKRQALGKGLNALLADSNTDITGKNPVPLNNIAEIPINEIEANPFQPREAFNDADLEELVESIKVHGIIQPVTVRKIGRGKYQLISGERRIRASIRAGLKSIPAYVRIADDQGMLEMSLIENIHRENLNAIEIGISYKRLIEECDLKQEELAARIGKNRTTVTNYLRLLKLPEEIQLALRDNKLSMGHARSLITIDDKDHQLAILDIIIKEDLSVREVEELVKQDKSDVIQRTDTQESKVNTRSQQVEYTQWEKKFSDIYLTKVKIKPKKDGRGEVVIPFRSEEELERIASLISKK
ncbi:MAG: ParB/RepB/Spo0J family partition protein [Bacteroidetes bacterium]|nr:ParB/RepB/Spo0J family partition protein [Bacteroidota bacterium]